MLRSADPAKYKSAVGVVYPNTRFGNSLKQTQIAQLLKANLGVEAAFADIKWMGYPSESGKQPRSTRQSPAGVLRLKRRLLARHG
jgi:hypothetical protein